MANTSRDHIGLVRHAKSRLLDTSYTENDRLKLDPQLQALIDKGIIRRYGKEDSIESRDVQDVIADFLAKVFEHTKSQLTLLHGFSDRCPVQFVITVPTIWSPQSSRILQASMQDALEIVEFGLGNEGVIKDLFIISEPEAAATYIIQANSSKLLVNLQLGKITLADNFANVSRLVKHSSYWTAVAAPSTLLPIRSTHLILCA
jgi:hypothetical protein